MNFPIFLFLSGIAASLPAAEESLPPLRDGKAPQNFEELWSGYDPRKEPLETEVLKEWEEDGVVLRVVRFRIGVFKGQKAMLAGVYGFPKGGTNLPALLQIHGGGQYADSKAPLTNAKRGYASISISWAGRISAPGYSVPPDVVALFWAGKKDDPKYRVTTDWGALDGYHAPCRYSQDGFQNVAPKDWTLDAVESPRNNGWFLCALSARRALTFLEQQPEVDPDRLGVYGHSMGGKLTVMTAATDSRVKVAAPSCGGISDRTKGNALYLATLSDGVYLRHITCPILFLNPANDFHARISDLEKALGEIRSQEWRVTCSPHHNHQDTEPYQVAGPLWFDRYLKGTFQWPKTPEASLALKTGNGVPTLTVKPDSSRHKILGVDLFFTQQGIPKTERDDHENAIARFWHHAEANRTGDTWMAELPLLDTDRPLWAYANVLYSLPEPVSAAGYYYGPFTARTFNVSSVMCIASPQQMKEAEVKLTDQHSRVIEPFTGEWQNEWFTYDLSGNWPLRTHKLYDPKWKAPEGAKLVLDVRCEEPNKLVVGLDETAAEVPLLAGAWQTVALAPGNFKNAIGTARSDWTGIRELRLVDRENLVGNKGKKDMKVLQIGAAWKGKKPEFRNLRWEGE